MRAAGNTPCIAPACSDSCSSPRPATPPSPPFVGSPLATRLAAGLSQQPSREQSMKSLVRFFSFESMVTAAVTILAALTVTLLALPVIALADEAGGTYMTFVRSASESRLPDGNVVRVMHYFQAGTSESAGNPFEGKNSECIGRMVGKPAGPFNT